MARGRKKTPTVIKEMQGTARADRLVENEMASCTQARRIQRRQNQISLIIFWIVKKPLNLSGFFVFVGRVIVLGMPLFNLLER